MITKDEFVGYYETRNGLIKVWSGVVVHGDHIKFEGLTLYPTTGAHLHLPVGEGVGIFHCILDEARDEGFASCTIEAFRTGGANPGRMLIMTRRLR